MYVLFIHSASSKLLMTLARVLWCCGMRCALNCIQREFGSPSDGHVVLSCVVRSDFIDMSWRCFNVPVLTSKRDHGFVCVVAGCVWAR